MTSVKNFLWTIEKEGQKEESSSDDGKEQVARDNG